MACTRCGAVFEGRFCPRCGTPVTAAAEWPCPRCGTSYAGSFCPACGLPRAFVFPLPPPPPSSGVRSLLTILWTIAIAGFLVVVALDFSGLVPAPRAAAPPEGPGPPPSAGEAAPDVDVTNGSSTTLVRVLVYLSPAPGVPSASTLIGFANYTGRTAWGPATLAGGPPP